jgi:hypothetical protein
LRQLLWEAGAIDLSTDCIIADRVNQPQAIVDSAIAVLANNQNLQQR